MSANLGDPINRGIRIVHAMHPSGKGGVTIAWAKETDHGHMLRVATAYCSKNDIFTKKIGTAIAIDNFLNDNTVLVPVYSKKFWDIPEVLRAMFYTVPFYGQ